MVKHCAEALYAAAKSLRHTLGTKDEGAPQAAVHRMVHIGMLGMTRMWLELKLTNGKLLVKIPKNNAHLIDLEWTDDQQAKLKTLVEKYPFRYTSGACRVHRLQLL
jgi:hypothetical protein